MNNRRSFLKTSLAISPVVVFPKLIHFQDPRLKQVLIIGDSISIGYTAYAQNFLPDIASVSRPMLDNGSPENCEGTTKGVQNIERWVGEKKWDLIHFNFGLHDLKHVDPSTGKNSSNPNDPLQAGLKQYKENLEQIVDYLKGTGAQLIFATTTPYPDIVDGPLRDPGMPEKYNKIARKIMLKNDIPVNDLYLFAKPRLDEIQLPHNVHFNNEGYRQLGMKVAERIRELLQE
ncbi:SGNH/GDSL hydrolase family protein [Maribellus sp. YY47]|uniref:SGNH/GDSL hydrolase family protein n=1 Tax=Maribellus sp. YY47 TaxID=2929486 RepID=UPI0020009645|nr:SGNH/GDSL hydrolase family protein [Maribellus sp. YY47]MCK3684776.1 SGNH/GDSL hydrolase family protein [Maribellus sp. YY47]